MTEQFQHALFGLRIIPAAKPGMKDAFLLIDDDQCRVCLELHADFSPGLLTVSHFNIAGYGWQATLESQKIAAFGSSYGDKPTFDKS
jgi:predicted dienelactone hydrolase